MVSTKQEPMSIAARRFFQFLLKSNEPPYELVAELSQIAKKKYDMQDYVVSLNKLVGWAKIPGNPGSLVVKKWAYAAALDMCLQRGYVPQTEEELLSVIQTWLGYHSYPNLEAAQSDFSMHVKVPEHLQKMMQDCLKEYYPN